MHGPLKLSQLSGTLLYSIVIIALHFGTNVVDNDNDEFPSVQMILEASIVFMMMMFMVTGLFVKVCTFWSKDKWIYLCILNLTYL